MKKELVAALIIKDKKLLLVHNKKYDTTRIEPPGGKKHSDETWQDAVIREVKEELGVIVRPGKLLGVYDTVSPEGDFTVRMYLSEIVSGEPRVVEPDKIPGFGWYSLVELRRLKGLVPNMVTALGDLEKYLR
jgi:8-oxo-dGTP diphosphatase